MLLSAFATSVSAQDPILLSVENGVEAWSVPQSLPDMRSDEFSATKLVFRTVNPGARIATFEGIHIGGDVVQTWSTLGGATVVGPTVSGRPQGSALYADNWADLDSHLLIAEGMIAGGVYDLTEGNDSSYGSSFFENNDMEIVALPESGIGAIQIGPRDAFFLSPEYQGNEIEFAYLVTPKGGNTSFTAGVLGAGFTGDLNTQTETRFNDVKVRFGIRESDFFCTSSLADTCFDFETNPTDQDVSLIGDAQWRQINGLDDSGYLSLTDTVGDQRGVAIFPDFGIGQLVIGASTGEASSTHDVDNLQFSTDGEVFSFTARVRIGGGDARPSNGLSFSFVAPDDPLLTGNGEGYAGIGLETNLPEEGSTTGLSIGLDEWQDGPASDPADPRTITTKDIVGMSVRLDGQIVGHAFLPTLNGELDDVTSLQTGSRFDGVEELGWAEFSIEAPVSFLSSNPTTNGIDLFCRRVQITWKGQQVDSDTCLPEPSASMMTLWALLGLPYVRRILRPSRRG